jgi:hypothetical protein
MTAPVEPIDLTFTPLRGNPRFERLVNGTLTLGLAS